MTTKTIKKAGITIKEAVTMAKPFAGSQAKKNTARKVLKAALVTESHVIVTDSYRLIRIKHNETITESYLHHYSDISKDFEASNYPQTDRLMPDPTYASSNYNLNTAEWIEAHEAGLVAATNNNKWSGSKNNVIELKENKIIVDAIKTYKVTTTGNAKKGIKPETIEHKVLESEQISFSYTLDHPTSIEKVAYNCEYMLQALKVAKKLKKKSIDLHFFGPERPFLLTMENVEIIILPVRALKGE